jgi:hypothetical protein
LGEGHYYENQNIENQKEHRKKFKASEHHYYDITTSKLTKITTTKVVRHNYENQNIKNNEKNIESLSFV